MNIQDIINQLIAEGYSAEDARKKAEELLAAQSYEYDIRTNTENYVKNLMKGTDGIAPINETEARKMAQDNQVNIIANYERENNEKIDQIRSRLNQMKQAREEMYDRAATLNNGVYDMEGVDEYYNANKEEIDKLEKQLNDLLKKQKEAFEDKRSKLIDKNKKEPEMKEDNQMNTNQEQSISERIDEIRSRLSQMKQAREEMYDRAATLNNGIYDMEGVDEYYNAHKEEIDKLENELSDLLKEQKQAFEDKRNKLIEESKAKRDAKNSKTREETLSDAHKFFANMNTSTTTGYDVSGLSEEELLDLYNEFLTNSAYHDKTIEVLKEMEKTDKETANSILEDIANSDIKQTTPLAQTIFEQNPNFKSVSEAQDYIDNVLTPAQEKLAEMQKENEEQKEETGIIPVESGEYAEPEEETEIIPQTPETTDIVKIEDPDCEEIVPAKRKNCLARLKDKFLEKWKNSKAFKIAVIAGAVAIVGGVAYTLVTGEMPHQSIINAIMNATGGNLSATGGTGQEQSGVDLLNSHSVQETGTNEAIQATDVSEVTQMDYSQTEGSKIFESADDAVNNNNSMEPNQWYNENAVDAYDVDKNQWAHATADQLNTVEGLEELQEQGYDAIAQGKDMNNISGFNTIDNVVKHGRTH